MGLPSDIRPRSALAMLQATGVVLVLGLLLWGIQAWHESHPQRVMGLVVLVFTGHAWVLALECALAAWQNRSDSSPRASLGDWLKAWWCEVRIAPQIFAWRQPFAWRRWPDSAQGAAPTDRPVAVLIHGFVCNRGFWLPWMQVMGERGLAFVSVNLEPVFGSIDEYVPQIEEAVARAEALGDARPILICHSMGGLAARAWLASVPDNAMRVERVITIGTPHRGTWLARFSHLENGRQMGPQSPWLLALEEREAALTPEPAWSGFVCWYSNTDNIVFPASTATLPGADNRLIRGAAHVDLAFHPAVMDMSLEMLTSAPSSPKDRTAS